MNALLWIAVILIVLWLLGWVGFQLAGWLVHALLVIGLILLIIWAIRRMS